MISQRLSTLLVAMVFVCVFSGSAYSILIDRGGGLIYDTDLDITWLQDANYAGTMGYTLALYGDIPNNGKMYWDDAMTWAGDLVYYDSVRDVYWDDWRLPTTDGTIQGYTNQGEMGHLYYSELGNLTGEEGGSISTNNNGPFINIRGWYYWTDTEYSSAADNYVGLSWSFSFDDGTQHAYSGEDNLFYAWAVRGGDIIPEPSSLFLFGSGLIGLIGLTRRIKGK